MRKFKKREANMSYSQKAALVAFMTDHAEFLQGKVAGIERKEERNRLWEELTVLLNNIEGAVKDSTKWQKVWMNLKNKTRRKSLEINALTTNCEAGPNTVVKLTDMQRQILHLMTKESVEVEMNMKLESDMSFEEPKIIPTSCVSIEEITTQCFEDVSLLSTSTTS
ncbi:uncharacterized protein [Onthophagus taurus]|uniref:uncharacterized protein n=1 Tax=Onthophagus taurus TaxID=166361 RepID=UPI0039BDB808